MSLSWFLLVNHRRKKREERKRKRIEREKTGEKTGKDWNRGMVGTHLITYNTYHISTNWAFSLSSFICGGQVSDFGVYCLQKLFLGSDMSSFYISLCGFRVLCLCLK